MPNFAIQVKDEKEFDRPRLGRLYTAFLSNKYRLEMKISNSSFAREKDERWETITLFQDESHSIEIRNNFPTKLFSPQLVQEIDFAMAEIRRLDKEWISTMKEFTDCNGVKWVRA